MIVKNRSKNVVGMDASIPHIFIFEPQTHFSLVMMFCLEADLRPDAADPKKKSTDHMMPVADEGKEEKKEEKKEDKKEEGQEGGGQEGGGQEGGGQEGGEGGEGGEEVNRPRGGGWGGGGEEGREEGERHQCTFYLTWDTHQKQYASKKVGIKKKSNRHQKRRRRREGRKEGKEGKEGKEHISL